MSSFEADLCAYTFNKIIFPVLNTSDQEQLHFKINIWDVHVFAHLSEEQKSIIGERLVLVGALLLEPYPLSQCIIYVLGISPQLLILCGLEKNDESE